MPETKAKELFAAADQLMAAIDEEVNRPEEDIIAPFICSQSRKSIQNYLTAFLLQNGTTPQQPIALADLLKLCQEIDNRFEQVDLSAMNCRFETDAEDHVCHDVKTVSQCFHVAREIKDLIAN